MKELKIVFDGGKIILDPPNPVTMTETKNIGEEDNYNYWVGHLSTEIYEYGPKADAAFDK